EDLAEIALLCAAEVRRLGVEPRIAMLSFSNFGSSRHPLAEKVRRGFGIRTAFSTSALAAPAFAAAATRAKIDQSFYLDDVLMNVARAMIQEGSTLDGRTVAWAEDELDLTIVMHETSDAIDPHPAPDVTLRAGDCVVVFASLESLARLREMSGEACDAPGKKGKGSPRRPWLARLLGRDGR
ncbi:MAG: phosphate acyltransferase, partial [Anaerolineae bacterium]